MTVATLEFRVLHRLAIMDDLILLPNLIKQVLSWRVAVDTTHFFDDQLRKFMVPVN